MRNKFDLSHYAFQNLGIGGLQTLTVMPILPGDSIDMLMHCQVKLSPLRRALSLDAQVDLMGFYVPHRQIYGDDWINFIEGGVDNAVTLTGKAIGAGTSQIYSYLGGRFTEGITYPRWRLEGYNRIWDRYFRHKTLTPDLDATWVPVDSTRPTNHTATNSPIVASVSQQNYGFPCSRLPTPWNRGIVSGITTADTDLASVNDFSIIDLNALKARYKTEQERDWFMKQYPEIMKGAFGTGVSPNIGSQEFPEMLFKNTYSVQGYDIDGTDDATLGVSSGKAIGTGAYIMPRKYFPEHGALWIMALVRFPTIMEHEMHPLAGTDMSAPTYKQLAGDPDIVSAEPPASDDLDSWSTETGNIDIGTLPFGQHYRWQPNVVHSQYDTLLGYPFINSGTITNHQQAVYIQSGEYDDIFQSKRLGNAQAQCAFKVNAYRKFPGPKSSIFAGA